MRILITNDDGIHAPGLAACEKIARELSDDIWVVAPEADNSGASHSLTLATPVRARRLNDRAYAVSGTPSDCVLLALLELIPGPRPDLVLSGFNRGGNLGEDITYSGTVAAAMEATLFGVPAIALSQDTDHTGPTRWATAETHAPGVIRRLLDAGWPDNVLINVNFPDVDPDQVAGLAVTRQGRRKPGSKLDKRQDPRGRTYYWIDSARTEVPMVEGSDLEAIGRNQIAITPLHLDLTHHDTCRALGAALG